MTGIQTTDATTNRTTDTRPTMIISCSEGEPRIHTGPLVRTRCQMSTLTMVEAELKTEVRDDIRAAIITANIIPLNPVMMTFARKQ